MSLPKVAVSGVTGFVGAQIASDLLKRGYTVHGTVRRNTPEKIAHLTSTTHSGTLKVFEADLLKPSSFDTALEDCTYGIHVASPFASNVSDPQKDLVDPAVNGTLNFLKSCKKAGVKKVVLTSSLAAISDGGVQGKVFDENDWNGHSSLKFLPYYFSKVEAEKAAWKYAVENQLRLVVINPVIILGPSLVSSANESASIVTNTIDGQFYGILDFEFPVVDVRDVSEAHIRAMENENAEGRYVCYCGEMLTHRELAQITNERGFKPPMRDLSGKAASKLIRLSTHLAPGKTESQYTKNHLGNPIIPSNAKIVEDLGMQFRKPREMLEGTLESLIKYGHLKDPKITTA